MSYNGYLLQIGTYVFPTRFIKADGYKVTYSTSDLDSYRDANGELHRQALTHKLIKVEFETIAMLTDTQMETIMGNIRNQYIDSTEKKVTATVYVPETNSYISGNFYIPDIEFTIYGNYGNELHYDSTRFALIQY